VLVPGVVEMERIALMLAARRAEPAPGRTWYRQRLGRL
jgi:hypothetical protein